MNQKNVPTIIVIFGATGDLMAKKIVPALFHLFEKKKLPHMFHIIGFSRRNITADTFKSQIREMLLHHHDLDASRDNIEKFLAYFSYHRGDFTDRPHYDHLAETLGRIDGEWKTCANKLFYLAVPPTFYETIFKHLAASGLTIPCGPDGGWTRVLVEKPFGHDLKTSESLDILLGKLFKEEQIYRIDHYLAKEMLQNILTFRFSNNMLESSWNNQFIEQIEIRLYENFGVEERGSFYDGLGALRDVGQNHFLQILSLITMDHPVNFNAQPVRTHRAKLLRTLETPDKEFIKNNTYRAQYEGYHKIKGVDPRSKTETYFKVKTFLNSPRWQGVPIIMEGGKRIKKQIKEIVVTFKHAEPCLCPVGEEHYRNKVVFSLEPKEGIRIYFLSKAQGLQTQLEERTLDFTFRKRSKKNQYVEEYEKLLLDSIEGNQLLFVSTDEVKSMWRFIDPIVKGWEKDISPLQPYKPDTLEPVKRSMHLNDSHTKASPLLKEIGVVGLGKMGKGIARHLIEKGWTVYGYNRTSEVTNSMASEGLNGIYSLKDFIPRLVKPRIIWLMVPAGKPVDEMIFGKDSLAEVLEKGDIIVEAGNSYYKDAIERSKKLAKKGILFIDVGTSGGPGGARYGASLMVGGEHDLFEYLKPLLTDLAVPEGVQFFEGAGAGHFVKMVHNGIEYGMMQAIAEGFAVMKKAQYKLDLEKVSDIYNHGSVVESKLVGWLNNAFKMYGQDLKDISGSVKHTGEGAWTVKTAEELNIKTKVIKDALQFRIDSEKDPSYTGKVLSALRNQFGGHDIK